MHVVGTLNANTKLYIQDRNICHIIHQVSFSSSLYAAVTIFNP